MGLWWMSYIFNFLDESGGNLLIKKTSPCDGSIPYSAISESFHRTGWGQLSKHQLQNSSLDLRLPQQQRSHSSGHIWIPVHPCRASWCRTLQLRMAVANKTSPSIRLQEDSGTWGASRRCFRFQGNHWSVDTRRYLYIRCLGKINYTKKLLTTIG